MKNWNSPFLFLGWDHGNIWKIRLQTDVRIRKILGQNEELFKIVV